MRHWVEAVYAGCDGRLHRGGHRHVGNIGLTYVSAALAVQLSALGLARGPVPRRRTDYRQLARLLWRPRRRPTGRDRAVPEQRGGLGIRQWDQRYRVRAMYAGQGALIFGTGKWTQTSCMSDRSSGEDVGRASTRWPHLSSARSSRRTTPDGAATQIRGVNQTRPVAAAVASGCYPRQRGTRDRRCPTGLPTATDHQGQCLDACSSQSGPCVRHRRDQTLVNVLRIICATAWTGLRAMGLAIARKSP